MVTKQGVTLTLLGLVTGLLAAMLPLRIIAGSFEGASLDWKTFALSVVGLALVAVLAAFQPAWRATRVDPLTALRSE